MKKKVSKLRRKYKQTGTTTTARDRKLKAKKPGYRKSKSGNVYLETRKNRSDKSKKKRL